MKLLIGTLLFVLLFSACNRHFDPNKTYKIEEIKSDYALMRRALEEAHPGLNRYTAPDSLKIVFEQIEKQLNRPMTEREFRRVVTPVFASIGCGHSDIYASKGYVKYNKKNKPKEFPLTPYWSQNKLRIMQNRTSDTTLTAGTEIVELDGQPIAKVIADMQLLIPSDGYNKTYKNVVINNNFGPFYRFMSGKIDTFRVVVKDTAGRLRAVRLAFNNPPRKVKKSSPTAPPPTKLPPIVPLPTPKVNPKISKADLRRNLTFSEKDSSLAILDINTFRDHGFKRFYRRSFKTLQQRNTKNLVIDLRNNGGGRSDASVNLMSYLLDSAFVVYRQVEAPVAKPSFNKYLGWKFLRFGVRNFWSKRTPTGGLLNRATGKTHKPSRKYHFDGRVFVLTNGGSFSASAIFASIVQQHGRVRTVGRETGGGRYGCNAFVSPMLTLPNTKTQVRMPMFKIVLEVPGKDAGHGVMPDFPVEFRFEDALKNRDLDLEKVEELLKTKPF